MDRSTLLCSEILAMTYLLFVWASGLKCYALESLTFLFVYIYLVFCLLFICSISFVLLVLFIEVF